MQTTRKKDGKLKSLTDLQKYKDAIMWGAQISGELLPAAFYSTFDEFLAGYKKEWKKGRKSGIADDISANPIPMALYQRIL